MRIRADMIGERFGRWSVVAFHGKRGSQPYWDCVCDCGAQKPVNQYMLRSGGSKSCGCLSREVTGRRSLTHGHSACGKVSTEYSAWQAMMARCSNPNNSDWPNYGERGITVCERWHKFENFLADVGERPKGMTVDRRDVNGHYSPDNFRWISNPDQQRNKQFNHYLEVFGKRLLLVEWEAICGISRYVLYGRVKMGWDAARIVFQEVKPRKPNRRY